MNIKILPIQFIGKGEVKGFKFKQLIRSEKACLYEVDSNGHTYYEVFKIRIAKKPFTYELYEPYPKANSFGYWTWTYSNYKKATLKFNEIDNGNNEGKTVK